ncbi:cytochrome c [uncultured Erythrobacter sp.]|uniref:c-type cytochrome n=1 Tax=uncultured Erythrobacter sp. TaxID=263913 RepID=UPI002639677B|nr:cytochrome c [uncultured Erythrobacter sp.]
MLRSFSQRTLTAAACVALLSACGGEATDGSEPEAAGAEEPAIIDVRQTNFEEIGDAFKAIRGQLEGDSPDFAVLEASATTINANAQKIGDHFPEGTGMDAGFDTEALATIWEKPEDFTAAHQKLIETSEGLITAAQSGDVATFQAAAGELGKSCKGCHDQFRVDDD